MIKRPEYITKLENDTLFSTMEIKVPKSFNKFITDRSYELVHSETYITIGSNIIQYKSKIYKTKQDFYLYLSIEEVGLEDSLVIYFKQEQLNELTLFINQLLKIYKNATVNN